MKESSADYSRYMCRNAKSQMHGVDWMVSMAERRIAELKGKERITDIYDMYRAQRDFYKETQKLCDRIIRKHCHDQEEAHDPADSDSPTATTDGGGMSDHSVS